ncbi:MAG: thiol-disulfide oxidoreductase DCC family protein [Longimicrobiales bacterium]|nr:thiol-disulfide oxidoreductase DCC family protein [Longimicrobiales bacterium]
MPHSLPPRLILFDGVCNLCNGAVQWVIERDPQGHFHFASLQSEAARRALGARIDADAIERLPDSIVLVDAAGVHTESTAAIRIARGLGRPWSFLGIARFVPTPIRDFVYRFIARNRYRWFGRREACILPAPGVSERFLDADESELYVPPA